MKIVNKEIFLRSSIRESSTPRQRQKLKTKPVNRWTSDVWQNVQHFYLPLIAENKQKTEFGPRQKENNIREKDTRIMDYYFLIRVLILSIILLLHTYIYIPSQEAYIHSTVWWHEDAPGKRTNPYNRLAINKNEIQKGGKKIGTFYWCLYSWAPSCDHSKMVFSSWVFLAILARYRLTDLWFISNTNAISLICTITICHKLLVLSRLSTRSSFLIQY